MSVQNTVSEIVSDAVAERHGSVPSQYAATVTAVSQKVAEFVDEAVQEAITGGVNLGASREQVEEVLREAGLLGQPQTQAVFAASAASADEPQWAADLRRTVEGLASSVASLERTAQQARSRYGIS